MYIYTRVYVYVCMNVYVYVCMYVCIFDNIYYLCIMKNYSFFSEVYI